MARIQASFALACLLAASTVLAQGPNCNVVTFERQQPIEFVCSGTTIESTSVTTFVACAPTDCPAFQGQVFGWPEAKYENNGDTLTIYTTGSVAGTTTLPAVPGGLPTVVITDTVFTEGPVPGTTTVTEPDGETIVVVTTRPSLITSTTQGPVPGTTTVTEPDGETVVVVTTRPSIITLTTQGPVPGTTTITGPGGETIVAVTTKPDIVTSFTEGPRPGTTTLPVPPGSETTIVIITTPVIASSSTTDEPDTEAQITPVTTPDPTTPEPSSDPTPEPTPEPTEPPLPTFSCDQYGYLIQSKALYQVDITSGDQVLVKNPVGDGDRNINAIAYHPTENIIYGVIQTSTGDSNLIKISADGTSEILGEVPHSINGRRYNLNIGEITDSLQFWFGAAGSVWFQMDLSDPGSPTYQTVVASGTANPEARINDWVQVPGAGSDYLYSIGADDTTDPTESVLERWSTSTKTWETLQRLGHLVGEDHWGALYADNDGNMYGSENFNGAIYQFPIEGLVSGTQTPVRLAQGPLSSRNDGARCHAADLVIPN